MKIHEILRGILLFFSIKSAIEYYWRYNQMRKLKLEGRSKSFTFRRSFVKLLWCKDRMLTGARLTAFQRLLFRTIKSDMGLSAALIILGGKYLKRDGDFTFSAWKEYSLLMIVSILAAGTTLFLGTLILQISISEADLFLKLKASLLLVLYFGVLLAPLVFFGIVCPLKAPKYLGRIWE